MVKCGIVGFANVGKSTLFNALLKKQVASAANYPFTTIEPNVGIVEVPDERLQKLAEVIANENSKLEILNPKQLQNSNDKKSLNEDRTGWPPVIPAVVQFVDIAGLVKGAHKGEGLGNQFLSHIREVDVIVFVLRDFKNPDIVKTGENSKEDLEILKDELLLKDLEVVDRRIDSMSRELRGTKESDPEHVILKTLQLTKDLIGKGKWLANELSSEELEKIEDLQLLSSKQTIVVVNGDEGDLGKELESERVRELEIGEAIRICAKMEEELAGLSADEQKDYLNEVGIGESGLSRLIKKAYDVLSLMSFYTAGPKEV